MLTTAPPSMMQYGGVSLHPPARSILTGERPQTIWSLYTESLGNCFSPAIDVMMPCCSSEKALSCHCRAASPPSVCLFTSERNMASCIRVRSGASSRMSSGRGM